MSISCSCSALSGSSCRRIWIDPDIDASGLRISCAMPAAISPTAASRCCIARVALELLDVGHVLEGDEKPGAAAGRLEMGRAQADVDLAASVAGPVAELEAARRRRRSGRRSSASTSGGGSCSTSAIGRPTTDVERQAGDRLGRVVEGEDALRRIGGGQAARQAVDDVLVERLQVGDLGRRLLEPRAGRPHALGERAAQQRDREEPEHVQRDGVLRDRRAAAARRVAGAATGRAAGPAPSGTAPAPGRRRAPRSASRPAGRRGGTARCSRR